MNSHGGASPRQGVALSALAMFRRVASRMTALRFGGHFRTPLDSSHGLVPGRCPACRAAIVEEDTRYCPKCGVELTAA